MLVVRYLIKLLDLVKTKENVKVVPVSLSAQLFKSDIQDPLLGQIK